MLLSVGWLLLSYQQRTCTHESLDGLQTKRFLLTKNQLAQLQELLLVQFIENIKYCYLCSVQTYSSFSNIKEYEMF